jgi:hypothetical protein
MQVRKDSTIVPGTSVLGDRFFRRCVLRDFSWNAVRPDQGPSLPNRVLLTTPGRGPQVEARGSAIHLGKPQLNSSTSDGTASTDDASTDGDNRRNRQAPNSTRADNNPDQRNNVVHRTPVSESGTR